MSTDPIQAALGAMPKAMEQVAVNNPEPAPQTTPPPWTADTGFQKYMTQYGKGWDPLDKSGISGGYRLYRAYKLGIKPDAAGHLPDHGPNNEPLKTYADTNTVTNGIDNLTGYQVAPPNYTGPLTEAIIKNAHKYVNARTATRPGGPGGWDDVPTGKKAPAKKAPAGWTVPPDPAGQYEKKYGY